MVKIWHSNNQLRSKVNNEYTSMTNNNIVGCRGSPLSAYLSIIYAVHIMNSYIKMAKETHDNILKAINLSEMKVWKHDGPTQY